MDSNLSLWRSLAGSSEHIRCIPGLLYDERWRAGRRREVWRSAILVVGWGLALWLITLPAVPLRIAGGFGAGACGTLGGYYLSRLWRFRVDLTEIFEDSLDVVVARRCERARFEELIDDRAARLVPCVSESLTRVLEGIGNGLGELPHDAALHGALYECGVRRYLDERTNGGAEIARMLAPSASVDTLDGLAHIVNRISSR
jgi:hypothetical protein